MAEHEPCIGANDDWYTPPEIFAALGLQFDLDPCSPGGNHWVPARQIYTEIDDGLVQPWHGLVFMNPPFGARRGHVPWLRKFFAHANGIAIFRAYTSSDWWHDEVVRVRRQSYSRAQDEVYTAGWVDRQAPGHGAALTGMGEISNQALARCGLGHFIQLRGRARTA